MKKLTKKQIKEFVENDGMVCPVCGSNNLSGIECQGDWNSATSTSTCNDCGAVFDAIMKLVSVELKK